MPFYKRKCTNKTHKINTLLNGLGFNIVAARLIESLSKPDP